MAEEKDRDKFLLLDHNCKDPCHVGFIVEGVVESKCSDSAEVVSLHLFGEPVPRSESISGTFYFYHFPDHTQ